MMRILQVTSEAVPFAKTGGLADVLGALPGELERLGHEVTLIMPAYRCVLKCGQPLEPTGVEFSVPIGGSQVHGTFLRSKLPGTNVTVYLVKHDDYYDRDQLYTVDGKDFPDNCERFVFFSRAVLEAIRLFDLHLDVVHCHDWQSALVCALLKIEYRGVPLYERLVSLYTIHNLAYQGRFWHWDMTLTGLDWKYFNWQQMEFYGELNLMKTGLVFADALSTVSPRYAEEIQSAPLGCGLEGVLQQRRDVLSGIINGVDYQQWSPAVDPHLPQQYDVNTFVAGKAACKAALQAELGLPQEPNTPLCGFIGRIAEQKGIDLICGVMQEWLRTMHVQWVLLGTGEPKYEQLIAQLSERYPQKVAARLTFSNALAHRIEAASDIFLMPSRYEPCGLNQLYSLKYGAVPVVRATGGLVDTITNATAETLAAGSATGFSFRDYSALALSETLSSACDLYARPEQWRSLVRSGMEQDWSWSRSARDYTQLYERLVAGVAQSLSVGG